MGVMELRSKRVQAVAAGVVLATLSVMIFFVFSASGNSRGPDVGERPVDFTLKDIHGTEFTLSKALMSKPVLMVFGSFT